jgi:hypothetical protein
LPRGEDLRLAVPEVDLAIDGAQPGRVHDRGAVVEDGPGVLGEPADHDEVVRRGELRPAGDGRAVRRLGQPARLVGVVEHVAGGDELGQHDDARAGGGRGLDRGPRPGAVAGEVADDRGELVDGDEHARQRRRCVVCGAARLASGYGGQ